MTFGHATTPADNDTIVAARAGDPDALGALWCHHAPHIVRLLRAQRLRDPGLVADKIWRQVGDSIDQFDGNGEDFRRWVLKIASMHAHTARGNSTTDDATSGALAAGAFVSADDAGDQSIADALNAVTLLPPELAEVVMLRHVHDLSIDDIASVLSTSDGEARRLVHTGTNNLRRALREVDSDGEARDGGAEWTVTSLLRQPGTSDELLGEARGVDALLVAMANPTHRFGRAPRQRQSRRRAVAVVGAGAILAGGAAFTMAVARDRGESSTLAPDAAAVDDERNAASDGTENATATADRTGDPTTLKTVALTPAELAALELDRLAAQEADVTIPDETEPDTGDTSASTAVGRPSTVNGTSPPRNESSGPGAPRPSAPPAPVNVPTDQFDPRDLFPDSTTTTTAPTTRPPATPTTRPPTTRPPTTPTTRPPNPIPPTTEAPPTPTTKPPTTTPPVTTAPPPTMPPTTRPPITAPPTTRPPITAPPTPTTAPAPPPAPPAEDITDDTKNDIKAERRANR